MDLSASVHAYKHISLSSLSPGPTPPCQHLLTAYVYLIRLVLETLNPLPEDRKCFRMINGVLVERTVKDVKPALETNSEGLKKVLEELVKQYKRQQEDMEKWKVGIRPSRTHLIAPLGQCRNADTVQVGCSLILLVEEKQYTSCTTVA